MAKKDDDVQGLSIGDLIEALKALKGDDDATMQRRAQFEAEAHARLQRRENTTHPGISVFSHPEGDVARPKPALKCEMFWVGYPLEVEGLTPAEVDLVNRAEVGDYRFHRTDGSLEKLTVKGERSATGKLTKLEFIFPCRGDFKHNLPGMVTMLREAFGAKSAEQEEIDALRAELARVKATEVAVA